MGKNWIRWELVGTSGIQWDQVKYKDEGGGGHMGLAPVDCGLEGTGPNRTRWNSWGRGMDQATCYLTMHSVPKII